jgi:hypothetical protein
MPSLLALPRDPAHSSRTLAHGWSASAHERRTGSMNRRGRWLSFVRAKPHYERPVVAVYAGRESGETS